MLYLLFSLSSPFSRKKLLTATFILFLPVHMPTSVNFVPQFSYSQPTPCVLQSPVSYGREAASCLPLPPFHKFPEVLPLNPQSLVNSHSYSKYQHNCHSLCSMSPDPPSTPQPAPKRSYNHTAWGCLSDHLLVSAQPPTAVPQVSVGTTPSFSTSVSAKNPHCALSKSD